jgi:hypothetical protein
MPWLVKIKLFCCHQYAVRTPQLPDKFSCNLVEFTATVGCIAQSDVQHRTKCEVKISFPLRRYRAVGGSWEPKTCLHRSVSFRFADDIIKYIWFFLPEHKVRIRSECGNGWRRAWFMLLASFVWNVGPSGHEALPNECSYGILVALTRDTLKLVTQIRADEMTSASKLSLRDSWCPRSGGDKGSRVVTASCDCRRFER